MRRYKYITPQDKNLIFNCNHQTDRDFEKLRMAVMLFLYHIKLICKKFGDI